MNEQDRNRYERKKKKDLIIIISSYLIIALVTAAISKPLKNLTAKSSVKNEERLSSSSDTSSKNRLTAPEEVSADQSTFDSVTISWRLMSGAEKYFIYRAEDDSGKFNKIGETSESTFVDSKISLSAKYSYKVSAYNKNGEGKFSNIAEARPVGIIKTSLDADSEVLGKNNESGIGLNNSVNYGLAAEQGDWIYYSDKNIYSNDNNIYKMKRDGSSASKFYSGKGIRNLQIIGDWIYFLNDDKFCRIKTDGSDYRQISKEFVSEFIISGDWVYCNGGEYLFKMKLDGTNGIRIVNDFVSQFNMQGDWIYYTRSRHHVSLYRIKTDGSSDEQLTGDSCASINLAGDWIYYSNHDDSSRLYKIRTNGGYKTKVTDYGVNFVNVAGDKIIYENWTKEGQIYMMDLDGKNNVKLTYKDYNAINIAGGHIICYNHEDSGVFII